MKQNKMKIQLLSIVLIFFFVAYLPCVLGKDLGSGSASKQLGEALTKGLDITEKNLEAEPKDVSDASKTQSKKLIHQPTTNPVLGGTLDIIFLTLSFIRGFTIGGKLAEKGGKCSVEKPIMGLSTAELEKVCHSCHEDPYRICTEKRCTILGDCIPVETASGDNYRCEPGKCDEEGDVHFAGIKAEAFIDSTSVEKVEAEDNKGNDKDNERGIVKVDLGKVLFNTNYISINVSTKSLASCYFILDKAGAEMSEMEAFENNLWPEEKWQMANIMLSGNIRRGEKHTVYIKCKNVCGIPHASSYDFNQVIFELKEKPERIPPVIVYTDPETPGAVPIDWKKVKVSIVLDENGFCKYSSRYHNFTKVWKNMTKFGKSSGEGQDPGYNDAVKNSSVKSAWCVKNQKCHELDIEECTHCFMELDLTRGSDDINWGSVPENKDDLKDKDEESLWGPEEEEMWESIKGAGLEDITKSYIYNIRCSDDTGNIMAEEDTLNYIILGLPGYNISIIQPELNEITFDREPEIEVMSTPRITECKYKIFETPFPTSAPLWDEMSFIDEGFTDLHQGKHTEILNADPKGKKHRIYAACRDMFKLESRNKSEFTVKQDVESPITIRMYYDSAVGDYLVIEANEESECVYGTENCNFNFSDGNAMTSSDEFMHTAYWQIENNYYLKCKDKWANYPGDKPDANKCTAIINPYEVPEL